jgi:chemotaxis response regulator CheB
MAPDVVISDVMMPRCDGYGLLKRLRADERLGGTPVIFLTAKGMTADRIAGFQAGADDYIPKPFDPDELVARVHNVVRRQQRLLAEAARFADADIGQMAKQITEIRSLLGTGGSKQTDSRCEARLHPPRSQRAAAGGGGNDEQGDRPQAGNLHPQRGEVRQSVVHQDRHRQPHGTGAVRPGASPGGMSPPRRRFPRPSTPAGSIASASHPTRRECPSAASTPAATATPI